MKFDTSFNDVIGSTGDLNVRSFDEDGNTLDFVTVNDKQGVDLHADGTLEKNNLQTPNDLPSQEQQTPKIAKGGRYNGKNLEKMVGKNYSGGYFSPTEITGKIISDKQLATELEKVFGSLKELKSLVNIGAGSNIGMSELASQLGLKTPAGRLISATLLASSINISGDQQVIFNVANNYLELHSENKSGMQGVYMLYENSGKLYLPFSGRSYLNYYDVNTGKHLGGYEQSDWVF
ncbi:hypothetical protein [Aequorivita sinensis]|uniref:hypothetical protein n=1 Tax=Aequorivita sinensis TaxID=1382458 RepID=UPI002300F016|nr:hypothetical protein [Aequorivita sinensis]